MALCINDMVDVSEVLGLSVKYDAKERIQVNATAVDSLSSLHLRPGDIIRCVLIFTFDTCPFRQTFRIQK